VRNKRAFLTRCSLPSQRLTCLEPSLSRFPQTWNLVSLEGFL
jgi:hypothetical protein